MIYFDDLMKMPLRERAHVKGVLESDFRTFCQWMFWLLEGREFVWGPVQSWTAQFLADVENGEITRAIVNTKPRFGKSALLALWSAWWLLKKPTCRFLYVSYSDTLARSQSELVRAIVTTPEARLLWGVELRQDSRAKDLWKTNRGGWFRAVSSGGQVTGFGAGMLRAKTFSGALIIDDPLKPEDTLSVRRMEVMNGRYTRTLKNRTEDPRTPIVVLMQRLHDADLSGFLLNNGSGETWAHLRIPGVVLEDEEEAARERYKTDWSKGKPYPIDLPDGYVWPEKFGPTEDAAERLDVTSWAAQTLQSPRVAGGSMLKVSWFGRYERMDLDTGVEGGVWYDGARVPLRYMAVTGDTAAKTGERNDFSVLELWGVGFDGHLYLLDVLRGKWEAPELLIHSSAFLARYGHKAPRRYGWREVYIEDKSSGIGLVQQLRHAWGARVIPVERAKDKVSRMLSVQLPLSQGLVRVPAQAAWLPAFLSEVALFSRDMTHKHDDQVDALMDAVEMLGKSGGKRIHDVVT